MVLYADDINILIMDKDKSKPVEKTTLLMNRLESWFNENELILNIRRSCALSFHRTQRKRICKPIIVYNEVNIPYKSDVKFLGIQITENLRWNTHIKSIRPNPNKAYFIIKTLKETMSYKIIKSIYYSYFQSRLLYGIVLRRAAKESIESFGYKKVKRLIAGMNKRTSCRRILNQCRILTLPFVYILAALCFGKQMGESLEGNSQIYQHNTRGKHKVHIRACKTAFLQNNVLNNAIRLYNKLPEKISILGNFRSSKKEVKSLLIAKTLYLFDEFLNSSF
jgi:hypothetical protein